jgi:carbon-monoxide dehydrogenase medium subunit
LRPRPFEYYAPHTLNEALSLLSLREEAKVLAGGQSLITLMKLRLAAPKALIDINGIADLAYIREANGSINVGALTRHDQLAESRLIRERVSALAEAASVVADQQVRNRGTIGGSLAHADPGADLPTVCTALDARILAASLNDSRSISISDFFLDYFRTALREDEIVKEIQIPIPPPRSGSAYLKFTRGHNDFAVVSVATQLTVDADNLCQGGNIVLGGVAATPLHAKQAESLLRNGKLEANLLSAAAEAAAKGLSPTSDIRASAEYKLHLVEALTRRALETSLGRAKGTA